MPVAVSQGVCPLCGPDYPRAPLARGRDFEYHTTGDQEFTFNRCTTCATLVLDPRPADAEIASLYPPEYEPYRFDTLNRFVRIGRDLVQRRKTSLLARYAPPGGTIVDVGCGGGALLRLIDAHDPDRFRLVGWDYPGRHLDRLASTGIAVIAAPIDEGHVPPAADLFVLNQVIEHVPHPDRLLARLAGALRPGGHLVIETPDTNGLDARWFRARYWGGYHFPRHMVLFNRGNLRTLVERCGLQVVDAAHLASPAFWVQSLHHAAIESPIAWLAPLCTLRNAPLVALFAAWDAARARVTPTSNQRLVARRPS
jgi:SAM-dependent methyltransferase